MGRFLSLLIMGTLLLGSNVYAQTSFSTDPSVNDAFIRLRWNLEASCFQNPQNSQAYPNGVYLEITANGTTVYTEIIENLQAGGVSNIYDHYVGPGRSVNYTLRLYVMGPGNQIAGCSNLTSSGLTTAFRPPVNVNATDAADIDSVTISWVNKSLLSTTFLVVRKSGTEETVVATIPGSNKVDSVFTYSDVFAPASAQNMVNGVQYQYCIRTYSSLANTTYTEQQYAVCDEGSTYPTQFTATQFSLPEQVDLSWASLSSFARRFVIRRDGDIIANISDNTATTYSDTDPTYGQSTIYTLELYDALDNLVLQDTATGGVDAIGLIAGYVRNNQGVGIPGVTVRYEALVNNVLVRDSTQSNYAGYYAFERVYYRRQSSFVITASRSTATGTAAVITPNRQTLTLSNQNSSSGDINFRYASPFANGTDNISIRQFEGTNEIDKINFSWNYTSTADTTHFQLYREGRLVAIKDDSAGPPAALTDIDGKPGSNYIYELRAYALNQDSFVIAFARDTIAFPLLERPTNFQVTPNYDSNSKGVLTMTWAHNSTNFSGFNIYRNDRLIASVDGSSRRFSDYSGQPGATYSYSITAARLIDGETFESSPVVAPDAVYPDFFEVQTLTTTTLPTENAVKVNWTIPANIGNDDYFSGFCVIRDGEIIGKILKGDTYEFVDLLGIPGQNHNYAVEIFVELADTMFFSQPQRSQTASYPVVTSPSFNTAAIQTTDGKIRLGIDPAYNATYQNYDGFIVYAADVAIDTLQRHQTHAYHYPNEPGSAVSIPYSLVAYRNIQGQVYTSAPATLNWTVPRTSMPLEEVGNLSISKDFPMHVAVTWTYPEFKLSDFAVYRDGQVLDTLPTSARAYYDYTTIPGVTHEYSVKALFNGTESIPVYGRGRRRNLGIVLGQVFSQRNSENVDSLELRLINGSQTVGRTFSNKAGFYIIEDLPIDNGQSSLAIELQTAGRSVSVPATMQNIAEAPIRNQVVTRNYSDVLTPINYPPLPTRSSLADILEVVATPYNFRRQVAISWNVTEGEFDGFDLYRGFSKIASVSKGEPMFVVDSTGTGGIQYEYLVIPYLNQDGERLVNGGKSAFATFPQLAAVSNLTATASYFGNDNTVNLNWSHKTGMVSGYLVTRNEVALALVAAGGELSFEDSTGVPDQQYVYTVRAVLQQNNEIMISEPEQVTIKYPRVADPVIQLLALPDSNAVRITWTYKGALIDGYRIYRDGELIATLPASRQTFTDMNGRPGFSQRYTLVALLERGGITYQSKGAEADIVFPVIKPLSNFSVVAQPDLGNTRLSFNYYARGVDFFEMMYAIQYTDANNILRDSSISFTFFYSELQNNLLTFVDELAIPGAAIDYMVRAVSVRKGIAYYSPYETASIPLYPLPPTPISFTATDGTFDNRVDLSWSLPLNANIDSFEIRRDGLPIDTISGGRRTYTDFSNQLGNQLNGFFTYSIVAFRRDYGVNFRSQEASDMGWPRILRERTNFINDASATATYGWSLAAHQNTVAVGSPSSDSDAGRLSFLEFVDGQWILRRSYTDGALRELGNSVDVNAGRFIAGAPGTSNLFGSNVGRTLFFSSSSSSPTQPLDGTITTSRRGENVAISGSRYYTTDQPTAFNTNERNIIGQIIPSGNMGSFSAPSIPANQIYVSMDASDTYVVAGATTGVATEEGLIDVFRRSGNALTHVKRLEGEDNGNNFGVAVGISGDMLAVGASRKQGGRIYVYRIVENDPVLESQQQISAPGAPDGSAEYGYSVALNDNFLLVGARNARDIGRTTRTGLAYLYKRFGTTYDFVETLNIPNQQGTAGAQFGFSVAVSSAGFLIGAPYFEGRGGVFFYSNDLVEVWNERLSSVTASDGLFSNRTSIQWTFTGNRNYINGFKIYRNDELMATVGAAESNYQDTEGVPGKEYVYKVTVVTTEERESLPKSDKGHRKGAGIFEGDIITAVGSAPVPGVAITAEAVVQGEKYVYNALSDNNGHFYMDGIFYGDETVTYTLTASFEGHEFLINPIATSISPQNNIKSNIIFVDKTAYIVQGIVKHAGAVCGLDSITVRAISRFNDGSERSETAMTDANGFYSFVLRPTLVGLEEIRIEIDSVRYRTDETGVVKDSVLYHFNARSDYSGAAINSGGWGVSITNLNQLPQKFTLDFDNELTYQIEFFVTSVCGTPASSNGAFQIEVSTIDGCFQARTVTNASNGRALIQLPPIDDLMISVNGAAPNSVENLLIVDYLRYRPDELDLLTVHSNNFSGQYTAAQLDSISSKRILYHKPSTISIASEFGDWAQCPGNTLPRLVQQGRFYTIRFDTRELHQGQSCVVNEGYMIVNNAAAQQNARDTLYFNEALNQFEPYSFKAGSPNLVAPFSKSINIKYFSGIGDFLAELTIPVVVLGAAPLPGSDIIVDVKDSQGQVKLPIYVLRDPPGDGSFSMISEGKTFTKGLTEVKDFSAGGGALAELAFAVGSVGAFINIDFKGGGGFSSENTAELSFTTSQTIATSSDGGFVGPDADVLVGVGVAVQYGLVEELQYDEATCTLSKTQRMNISPNEIKTDWYYTVGQIKQLAQEKKDQAQAALRGELQIQVAGELLSPQEAADRLITEANNWDRILRYHQVESVPYYQLCAKTLNAPRLWAEAHAYNKFSEFQRSIGVFGQEVVLTPSVPRPGDSGYDAYINEFVPRVNNAIQARRQFCTDPSIGRYERDSFILNRPIDEIVFTTELAQKYERASRAMDYWLDSLYMSRSTIANRLNQPEPQSLFPTVENSTFSAGVSVEKSSTVSKTTSSTFSQRSYIDLAIQGGLLFKNTASAGFGFTTEVADANNKVGVQFELSYEWGQDYYSSETVESTVSYTLTDDDAGDQFSVTAIKGREAGHTPFFQLLGGRSSCPPEPGSIFRDHVDIALWDPQTLSTASSAELRNQDINTSAKFFVQMTNLSPFGETRDLFVYHDGQTNVNGAQILLGGQGLGGGNTDGLTYTFINANQPFVLPLEIIPSPGVYEYEDINIILRPGCGDGDLIFDTITVSAYFDSPCSDITIASPGNDWLIRRRNPLSTSLSESREQIVIELRDYDSSNPQLEEIFLEYRRIGDGSGWVRIPTTELIPNYQVVIDSLASYDNANFGPGQIPKFFFIWDITDRYSQYPDGIYEIRAVSFCGVAGQIRSNTIRGQVRRQTSDIFALTQPSDGIWQVGDEISIRINKEIDCTQLGNMSFSVVNAAGVAVPGQVFCFYDNNTLIFQPADQTLLSYDRQDLTAIVHSLIDETGNRFPDTFRWTFRVVARDIYVDSDRLQTTIYQGNEGLVRTTAFRNSAAAVSFSIDNLSNYPWIEADPATGTISSPLGNIIAFTIDGNNLPLGDTSALLIVRSTSGLPNQGTDTVRISVKVLAKPPYWRVDPSLYTQNMIAITNYEFFDEPGITSRDTMDRISAWIDSEIRGVAPIIGTNGGLFASFMAIYGDPSDAGKPIEFRIWDASEGREYNGYPSSRDTISFAANAIVGSFQLPEILKVDKTKDRARYIPLNGNGRWTWFSVNHQEPDMRVNTQLRQLTQARTGDLIKTARASASYVEGMGWISLNGLDSLRAQDGYQVYLQGPNDTIRVTGRSAAYGPIALSTGWNLVGYPPQQALPINPSLNITPARDGNYIKTVAQNAASDPLFANMFAGYTNPPGQWFTSGQAMDLLRPNFAYQILVRQPSTLVYPGATSPLQESVADGGGSTEVLPPCDPNNPASWAVDPALYPLNMIAIGQLEINGELASNPNTKVAAFVNGQCRGATSLYQVPSLGVYMVNLFIYGQGNEGEIEIRIFDAETGRIHLNQDRLAFVPNAIIGNFTQPYVFRNKLFSASFSTEHSLCETDNHASSAITLVTGLEGPYTYQWSTGDETAQAENLSPGMYAVTITGQGGIWFVDSVLVNNLAQPIEQPQVSASFDQRVCVGDDAAFYAASQLSGADYLWYDPAGVLLHQGPGLLLENIQQAFQGSVRSLHRGCLSAAVSIEAETYLPSAEFSAQPEEAVTTQTEVSFRATQLLPGGSWHWDFGDSHTAGSMDALHTFAAAGTYAVRLSVTDAAGCRNQSSREIVVESPSREQSPAAARLSLEAMPNPFNALLTARIQVEVPARYKLSLLDMEGRIVWNQQYQWEAGEYEIPIRLFIPDAAYLLRLENELGDVVTLQAVKSSPRP
jgi:hypothetical protein